jgi:hypothetical protein
LWSRSSSLYGYRLLSIELNIGSVWVIVFGRYVITVLRFNLAMHCWLIGFCMVHMQLIDAMADGCSSCWIHGLRPPLTKFPHLYLEDIQWCWWMAVLLFHATGQC